MKIIYSNKSGEAQILVPAPRFVGRLMGTEPIDIVDGKPVYIEEPMTEQEAMEFIANKDVPEGAPCEIVEDADIPADRTFRNAWEHDTTSAPEKVSVNIPKAKEIAHEVRRAARSEEFAPLDIKATIPAEATQAEADRQVVRDKYAAMQTAIDGASTPDEIKTAMGATT